MKVTHNSRFRTEKREKNIGDLFGAVWGKQINGEDRSCVKITKENRYLYCVSQRELRQAVSQDRAQANQICLHWYVQMSPPIYRCESNGFEKSSLISLSLWRIGTDSNSNSNEGAQWKISSDWNENNPSRYRSELAESLNFKRNRSAIPVRRWRVEKFLQKTAEIPLLHETNGIRWNSMSLMIVIPTDHISRLSHSHRISAQRVRLIIICQSVANEDVDRGQWMVPLNMAKPIEMHRSFCVPHSSQS